MNIDNALQGLSPEAQVILLASLLFLVLGAITLLLIVAYSRAATENICFLFCTICRLFKSRIIIQIDEELRRKVSVRAEKIDLTDEDAS